MRQFAEDFDAKGIEAVPIVLDILNCTELTDRGECLSLPDPRDPPSMWLHRRYLTHDPGLAVAGLDRLCEIDLEHFEKSRIEQRAADFALTGLRVQEVNLGPPHQFPPLWPRITRQLMAVVCLVWAFRPRSKSLSVRSQRSISSATGFAVVPLVSTTASTSTNRVIVSEERTQTSP